ncbi:hypothetical protein J132_11181 [Termitomyces sp. J132]|nr:hypothetical protein J132_11181 [Termitomyces sp. J132]
MALDEALCLGLTWDPDICLRMESANSQVNTSVGLAKNVPFTFAEGFTIYLQVHIFVKPAYTVLLGHPFDTLTESNIQNLQDGSAIITIRDPNTGDLVSDQGEVAVMISYRSQWFTVWKKDGESLRIVNSLEPLNKVTIAHSGLLPATEELTSHFAGRACGGIFDLRFVWKHLQNVNRMLQRIKYAGGTFSGKKSVVCADEIVVVGHSNGPVEEEAPDNPKQCTCAKLGSITLNEREARFSQPETELYGLMRALQANKYWLVGCRKFVVETDAKYLKGMLSNFGVGPNATIMRWIEDVVLYHFTLRHVPRKTFSVDGLSRRLKQPGDEEYPPVNPQLVDNPKTMHFEYPDKANNEPGWEDGEPLALEEFANQIDTRGGYLHAVATEVSDFEQELYRARSQEVELRKAVLSQQQTSRIDPVAVLSLSQPLLPHRRY